MPHVVLKIWAGKPEALKEELAVAVAKAVIGVGYREQSVSVRIEEFEPGEWTEKVYRPDILDGPGKLYRKPGYEPD